MNAMNDDHYILSAARNELCDALKVLLNPDRMGPTHFVESRDHVKRALIALNGLIEGKWVEEVG